MAVFSTNQNRQLYVVKAYNATVNDASAVGTIGGVKVIGTGKEKELFFLYKGADGSMKSDRIQLENLGYAKAFKASDMLIPLKKYEVTLNGNLISGQDYLLRINLTHWVGMSEYDQYFKDAVVHATSSMSASDFYKKMVESLNLSFSREIGATKTSNPYLDFAVDNTTTATKIIITEKPQEWKRGLEAQEPVLFDPQPTTIYDGSEDVVWGTVTNVTPAKANLVAGTNAIGNGAKIADLEWFCMGERGDQYRMVGYPNYIPTEYLADPTKEYNVIELHHAFRDEGVNSYRSEKDITIVVPMGATGKEYDTINSIIGAINTAVGSTIIATLS